MYKTGDTGVARGKSEISKTISGATKGYYTHTFQFIWLNGVLCVFDAQIEGCYPMEFERWKEKFGYEIKVFRNPNEFMVNYYSDTCIKYFGTYYDVKGLFVGLFKSATLMFWKRKDMKEKYRNNGKMWCSELSARLINVQLTSSEFTGKILGLIENPEDYSPQNIHDWLVKNKWINV